MLQNYYTGYAFVNRKNRKLRPNLLLTLRGHFQKPGPPNIVQGSVPKILPGLDFPVRNLPENLKWLKYY